MLDDQKNVRHNSPIEKINLRIPLLFLCLYITNIKISFSYVKLEFSKVTVTQVVYCS